MTDDRRVTTLLEAAYGWRAHAASYAMVQHELAYLPHRLSPQLAGHLLFDAAAFVGGYPLLPVLVVRTPGAVPVR